MKFTNVWLIPNETLYLKYNKHVHLTISASYEFGNSSMGELPVGLRYRNKCNHKIICYWLTIEECLTIQWDLQRLLCLTIAVLNTAHVPAHVSLHAKCYAY